MKKIVQRTKKTKNTRFDGKPIKKRLTEKETRSDLGPAKMTLQDQLNIFKSLYGNSPEFCHGVDEFLKEKGWTPVDAECISKLVRDLTKVAMAGLPPMPPRKKRPKVRRIPESLMAEIASDLRIYGNSYYSEIPELDRFAQCSCCGALNLLRFSGVPNPGQRSLVGYTLGLYDVPCLLLEGRCSHCGVKGAMNVEEFPAPGAEPTIRHHRWDPTRMHVQADPSDKYNPDKVQYFYDIPEADVARLVANDPAFIDRMPWAYLQACASPEAVFRFEPGKVVHLVRG